MKHLLGLCDQVNRSKAVLIIRESRPKVIVAVHTQILYERAEGQVHYLCLNTELLNIFTIINSIHKPIKTLWWYLTSLHIRPTQWGIVDGLVHPQSSSLDLD